MTEQENSEHDNSWMLQVIAYWHEKEFEKAIKCCDKMLQTDPFYAEAYFWRAKCYADLFIKELGDPGVIGPTQYYKKIMGISDSDSKVIEAMLSYERALELLPKEISVLIHALDFAEKVTLYPNQIYKWIHKILDSWLSNNPDCAFVWLKKGDFAYQVDDFSVAAEFYKKAIELIKSVYDLVEWVYDEGEEETITVIQDPDMMPEGELSVLEGALFENFSIYWETEDYSEMLKYFWELYYLTGNEFEIVNILANIVLGAEKSLTKKRIGESQQKLGLSNKLLGKAILYLEVGDPMTAGKWLAEAFEEWVKKVAQKEGIAVDRYENELYYAIYDNPRHKKVKNKLKDLKRFRDDSVHKSATISFDRANKMIKNLKGIAHLAE